MKMNFKSIFLLFFCSAVFFIISCTTTQPQQKEVSVIIAANGIKNADQLYDFFTAHNNGAQKERAKRLAAHYIAESKLEGINSDIAFIQMCLETGFLSFGNLVQPEWNNFCGLGAIDAKNPGLIFESEQIGVRAHVQHLKAYGTTAPLNLPLVDPRYRFVIPKGKAPTVEELSGTWAADKSYGQKLIALLQKLNAY